MLVIFRSYMDHAPRFRGWKPPPIVPWLSFWYLERFPGWNSEHVSGCLGGRAVWGDMHAYSYLMHRKHTM